MICQCRGCFRRIPEKTKLCVPCTPTAGRDGLTIAPWHGPGATHGYLGHEDEAQLDAIHNLLEWVEREKPRGPQELMIFYAAFRGE